MKLKKLEYFQELLGTERKNGNFEPMTFLGVIVDVRTYGMLIELPQFVITGLIHVSDLGGDFYTFDPVRLQFIGRSTRRVYQIGDKIQVQVKKVDIFKRQVDFVLAPETKGRDSKTRDLRPREPRAREPKSREQRPRGPKARELNDRSKRSPKSKRRRR